MVSFEFQENEKDIVTNKIFILKSRKYFFVPQSPQIIQENLNPIFFLVRILVN